VAYRAPTRTEDQIRVLCIQVRILEIMDEFNSSTLSDLIVLVSPSICHLLASFGRL